MKGMPSQVIIGTQVFDIVWRKRKDDATLHEGNYGYTLDEANLIVIDIDIHKTKKQVTLLHEIMHAARMTFDNEAKPGPKASFEEWEHYFIGVWENSLLLVLRDNPDIVRWLQK